MVAVEVEIETFGEGLLLGWRFGQHEGQGVTQGGAVGVADDGDRVDGVDGLGGGYPDAGAAGGLEEAEQRQGGLHGGSLA
ncbi:MAG TPA: hypothetical protein VIZ17_16940 [Acetobacteraceae bacterium]